MVSVPVRFAAVPGTVPTSSPVQGSPVGSKMNAPPEPEQMKAVPSAGPQTAASAWSVDQRTETESTPPKRAVPPISQLFDERGRSVMRETFLTAGRARRAAVFSIQFLRINSPNSPSATGATPTSTRRAEAGTPISPASLLLAIPGNKQTPSDSTRIVRTCGGISGCVLLKQHPSGEARRPEL